MTRENEPVTDGSGKYINCCFYTKRECRALTYWYNGSKKHSATDRPCAGCPFFKTREQFMADKRKYPGVKS